jgi:NDP-sugar pyrophosphorylase family protein
MVVMILSAGLGTRLGSLTEHTPKALIPILDIPALEWILIRLWLDGFHRFVVNIHYLPEQMEAHFQQYKILHDRMEITIEYSYEIPEILDTGGGIRHAQSLLDTQHFLVCNCDALFDGSLKTLCKTHTKHNHVVTLAVKPYANLYEVYNPLWMGNDHSLKGICRESNPAPPPNTFPVHFTGIQVFSEKAWEYFPKGGAFGTTKHVFPRMMEAGESIQTHPLQGRWFDTGTVDALTNTQTMIRRVIGEEPDGVFATIHRWGTRYA